MRSDNNKGRRDIVGTVYLIHFEEPYRHARHYIGWTEDLVERIKAHASGNGSPLMAAVKRAGIDWRLARTWTGDRRLERRLHHRHGSRVCPICNEEWMAKPGLTRAHLEGASPRSWAADLAHLTMPGRIIRGDSMLIAIASFALVLWIAWDDARSAAPIGEELTLFA